MLLVSFLALCVAAAAACVYMKCCLVFSDVIFLPDCVGPEVEAVCEAPAPGELPA